MVQAFDGTGSRRLKVCSAAAHVVQRQHLLRQNNMEDKNECERVLVAKFRPASRGMGTNGQEHCRKAGSRQSALNGFISNMLSTMFHSWLHTSISSDSARTYHLFEIQWCKMNVKPKRFNSGSPVICLHLQLKIGLPTLTPETLSHSMCDLFAAVGVSRFTRWLLEGIMYVTSTPWHRT